MGRRELNGVVAGLASSFISRNNDVDGYWSVGLLRSFADQHQLQTLRFDILNGPTQPDDPLLVRVCCAYQTALARQLVARSIDRPVIVEAEILVSFDSAGSRTTARAATYGSPFSCSVRLLDDHKKEHRKTLFAHCAPHDPRRESKSTRG